MGHLPILIVLAVTWAYQQSEDEGNYTALHMNHRGASKINVAMAQTEIRTQVRQPAIAPNPIPKDWIHDRADAAGVDHKGGEFPSLSRCAGRNRRGRIHEDHLEQEEREGGGIIADPL